MEEVMRIWADISIRSHLITLIVGTRQRNVTRLEWSARFHNLDYSK
jgi:hypothetical protein